MLTVRSAMVILLSAASLTACTTTQVERWEAVPGRAVDQAYLKPDADFSVCRRLHPQPLEVYYPEEIGKPDPADLARIRQIFREAFLAEIGDDYEIVSEAAADVLGVGASLIDLRTNRPTGRVDVGRRLASIVNAGHLTLLMEMSDSRTGETLARAADEEKQDAEAAGATDDWAAVEAAAERWARLFRRFLDNYLGQP